MATYPQLITMFQAIEANDMKKVQSYLQNLTKKYKKTLKRKSQINYVYRAESEAELALFNYDLTLGQDIHFKNLFRTCLDHSLKIGNKGMIEYFSTRV